MWLPPAVAEQQADIARQTETLDRWSEELKAIDPLLELVKAADNASTPGLRPGHYHVLRHNPGGPPSLMVVETPEGEFCEPGAFMLDSLQRADLWNGKAGRKLREQRIREAKARERQREAQAEERMDEFVGRMKAYTNPGVAFGTPGWTARAGARRG